MTACTLPGRPESAHAAREFITRCIAGCPSADDAVLCADELVANAIQHSRSGLPGGTIEVRVAVAAGEWLRVEVEDAGPLAAASPRDDRDGGRGLALVVALADVFGADGHGMRWFWLRWDAEASRPAPPPPSQTRRVGAPTAETHPCAMSRVGLCERQVPLHLLMCRADWFRVPLALRSEIWATWHGGVGVLDPPYRDAVRAAIAAVATVKVPGAAS